MRVRVAAVRVLIGLGGLFALIATPAFADRGGYSIENFRVELRVEDGAELLVEERLEVVFSEPRHGIYRSIPVRYTDPRGYLYSLGFRFDDVVDENFSPYETKVTNEGNYVKIRIGSADFNVSGRKVYVIRYRLRDAVSHFAENDELYWNATGNEWNTAIEHATAIVRLPGAVDDEDLELAGYTGRFGSRAQDVTISRVGPDSVSFAATKPLAPTEGLTVAVAWPHGLVTFPGPVAKTVRFVLDNLIVLAPLLAFVFLLRAYRRHGRDPAPLGSIVVRYEPPEGVSPGEVGTIVDEKVDLRDITATVVDLAVRGYLKIEVEEREGLFGLFGGGDKTVFERVSDKSDTDLLAHEKRILDGIFVDGDRVDVDDLRERFYKRISGIKDALYDKMVDRGYFARKPTVVRTIYMVLGFVLGGLTFLAGMGWGMLRGGVMPQMLILPIVAAVLTAGVCFVFAPAMPRRTRKGVELRRWAVGFEEFVDRVERERLEADRARNVFESLLPYAMALGIAAAWARQFEGIYEQGAGPAWFVGRHPTRGFSTRSFEKALSSAMSQTGEVMSSSPRSQGSSGAGGGGSSGGGGGGGGGSW